MKHSMLAITLILVGCSSASVKPVEPARNDDISSYLLKGDASVRGQAFYKVKKGDIKSAAGNDVVLVPAAMYSGEGIGFLDVSNHVIAKVSPNLRPYARITHANSNGHFEFKALPAGDYYLECGIYWNAGDSRTGTIVKKKVSLNKSQSLTVVLSE